MNRYLPDVIDKILAVLPLDGHNGLRVDLRAVQQKALYSSPEMQGGNWRMAAHYLNAHLGAEMASEWEKEIGRIFSGEEKTDAA